MQRSGSSVFGACLAFVAAALPQVGTLEAQVSHADAQEEISIALTGDAIITRKMSVFNEPAFLRMVDVIRNATASFTNLEILLHDYEDDVVPAEESGGTYMSARPEMAKELAWMGFDLVSTANNHSLDYSVGGMRSTIRAARAAGLVYAGTGENLGQARAPGYLETTGGRVALVSVASTFARHMRAGAQRKDLRGRPGLSPIRYSTTYVLPKSELAAVRRLRESLGLRGSDTGDRLTAFGATFVAGERPAVVTRPHEGDLAEVTAAVKDAKRQANWVIVSSHSHEGAGGREVPAQFLAEFARAVIDAGADVFVGHGPHVLRGIEIYKGKPIFYSLGNFIFQNETVEFQPADNYDGQALPPSALPSDFYDAREKRSGGGWPADPAYWESVVAVPSFRAGRLHEVRLYPVTLGHGLGRPQRGRPVSADARLGRKIIGDLQRLSQPFGTRIEYVDGIGRITLPVSAAAARP